MNKDIVLSLSSITKNYKQGNYVIEVIKASTLKLRIGEAVGIIGMSGSGKSTLLHIAGLLDEPTSGKVTIANYNLQNISNGLKDKIRLEYLGFVYQNHLLLKELTVKENVALPKLIAKHDYYHSLQEADLILTKLGLGEKTNSLPGELSGGEQQRVAIARALINKPKIILADEPTGNLDPKTANEVFMLLLNFIRQQKSSAIVVTHDYSLASKMDKLYQLDHGYLRLINSTDY